MELRRRLTRRCCRGTHGISEASRALRARSAFCFERSQQNAISLGCLPVFPRNGNSIGIHLSKLIMKRRSFWIVFALGIIIIVAVILWVFQPCIPPPGCSKADETAGRCVPQPYPCTEMSCRTRNLFDLEGATQQNRWTGATGSDFRIIIGPAKLLGNAVARSTLTIGG